MIFALPDSVGVVQWRHEPGAVVAYTPTVTSGGTRLRWAGSCVFLRPDAAGTIDIPGDEEWTILGAAGQAWQDAGVACGYLRFQLEAPEAGDVGLDYVNRVIVRHTQWSHDAGAIGLTTVFFVDRPGDPADGTILDADIELNAVDYALAVCDGNPGGCVTTGTGVIADIGNVLAHELGHAIGLDHTCWSGDPSMAPLDDDGQPVPPCVPPGSLPPGVADTTMFPFSDPEEIKKRSPEADDIDGYCGLYPTSADPMMCAPVEPPAMVDARPPVVPPDAAARPDAGPAPDDGDGGGCCDTGRGADPTGIVLLAALVLAFVTRAGRKVEGCGSSR